MAASIETIKTFMRGTVAGIVPDIRTGKKFRPAPGGEPLERLSPDNRFERLFRIVQQFDVDVRRPYGGKAMEVRQTIEVQVAYSSGKKGDRALMERAARDQELIIEELQKPQSTFPDVLVNIESIAGRPPIDIAGTGGMNAVVIVQPFRVTYDTE